MPKSLEQEPQRNRQDAT